VYILRREQLSRKWFIFQLSAEDQRDQLTHHLRYRLVVLATGSRYLSSHFKEDWSSFDPHLYLPGGPGMKKGKMFRTPSRAAERPASKGNRDDRCAVRTTATRRHESRVRGYWSNEEDTKNRRKKRRQRERKRNRDDRIQKERRERWRRERYTYSERAARARSGFAYQTFCRLK